MHQTTGKNARGVVAHIQIQQQAIAGNITVLKSNVLYVSMDDFLINHKLGKAVIALITAFSRYALRQ